MASRFCLDEARAAEQANAREVLDEGTSEPVMVSEIAPSVAVQQVPKDKKGGKKKKR